MSITKIIAERPYIIALLLSLSVIVWMLSGSEPALSDGQDGSAELASESQIDKVSLPRVRVRSMTAQAMARELVINGRTAAARSAKIPAQTSGAIIEVGAIRGGRVKQGALIARINMKDRDFSLQTAKALVTQKELEYAGRQKLTKQGFTAESQEAAARAELSQAKGQLENVKLDIQHTEIRAPFDGVLIDRYVEQGDFVDSGDQVAMLIDHDPFIVVGEVSETDVNKVKVGQGGRARLIDGSQVEGKIRYVSALADEATRTFRVELEIANPDAKISAGISAKIIISLENVSAHKVTPGLLTLNAQGSLGVKAINADNRVEFYPVDLLRNEVDGVWLAGLPMEVTLITVGQGFVRPGDQVEPITAEVLQ